MIHLFHAFLLFLTILPYVGLAFLVIESIWSRKTFMKDWPAYATAFGLVLASHIALVLLMSKVFL